MENLEAKKLKWSGFVEGTVVNFMRDNQLEEITVKDGKGNEGKIKLNKNNEVEVKTSSKTTL